MGSSDDCCAGMSRFLGFVSVVTFIVLAAGFANPYWLEKEMSIPTAPVPGAPTIELDINIGVLYACTDQKIPIIGDEYKCESLADIDADLIEDWQWVAAGLAIGSAVAAFLGLIISGCVACRASPSMGLRATAIVGYFLGTGMLVGTLVLFNENKDEVIVTTQPIVIRTEYDYNWGFYVTAVGACLLFVMALLHGFVACGARNMNRVV